MTDRENALSGEIDTSTKPTKKDITEAMKKKNNFMIIDFKYNDIVLPHDDGVKLMEALKNAELCKYTNSTKVIHAFPATCISFELISEQVYLDRKMSHLFKTTIDSFKE